MKPPVGFYPFHKNRFFNLQLNRWYSFAYTDKEELTRVAKTVRSFDDYVNGFLRLAETAEAENRLKNAAFYYRAAEFLTSPHDSNKLPVYDRFSRLFYRAFADEDMQLHQVPYGGKHLPAMKLPVRGKKKATIVAFPGFDAFVEEFYCIWAYLREAGYEVIAFEGPGQGAALRRFGLFFDHDWEKPTAAVLDYFNIDDAALLGISMGGYWCMRAAAFEKRISRVIAMPPVYDWMEMANRFNKAMVNQLLKWPRLLRFSVKMKMNFSVIRHFVNHTLFITGKSDPLDAVQWILAMNKNHIQSELVDQDVLLLGGERDEFQPAVLLQKQAVALVNARSVTTRIFNRAEQGQHHCQIGNLSLALDYICGWLARFDEVEAPQRKTPALESEV